MWKCFFNNINNTVKVSMTKLILMAIYQLVKLNFQPWKGLMTYKSLERANIT